MLFATNNLENIERIVERSFTSKNSNETAELSKYENDVLTFHSTTFKIYFKDKSFETDKPIVLPEGLLRTFHIKYSEYYKEASWHACDCRSVKARQRGPGTVSFTVATAVSNDKKIVLFFLCNDFISEAALKEIVPDIKEMNDEADSALSMIKVLKVLGKA